MVSTVGTPPIGPAALFGWVLWMGPGRVRVTFLQGGRQKSRDLLHSAHQPVEDQMEEAMDKEWRTLSEEVLSGMKEWRLAHPKATLREIELAAAERVSRLQARMVQDVAVASKSADWQLLPQEDRPLYPTCENALT